MIRVYIAAPFPMRVEALAVMAQLETVGIGVTSRWLKTNDPFNAQSALDCLEDIREANAVVAMNPPAWANSGTGGRHVEMGYALAHDIPVVIVGERSNIFHEMPTISVVPTSAHLAQDVARAVARSRASRLSVPQVAELIRETQKVIADTKIEVRGAPGFEV